MPHDRMPLRPETPRETARNGTRKRSYSIACPSAFRDRVLGLAARRGVNVGDIARSIMLTLPAETVAAFPDPGEPARDDRELVVLKSGPSAGKPWRRKPRLQARLPAGYDLVTLRKALGLALSLDAGGHRLVLEPAEMPERAARETALNDENARLRLMLDTLAFPVLADGVRTRDEALFVLGFPPQSAPDAAAIKMRYRQLAAVLHPDSGVGDNARMAQLNAAASILRKK